MKSSFLALVVAALSFSGIASEVTLEDTLKFLKSVSSGFPESATIESLQGVERVYVGNHKMSDDDFKYLVPLCKFEKITALNFVYNQLTGAGLKLIAEKCGTWESIRFLDLGGNPLEDEYLSALNAFPSLEGLNIDFHGEDSKSAIDGSFLRKVSLPKLRTLWAVGTSISDENALLILNFPALELFSLRGVMLASETIAQLSAEKINSAASPWDLRVTKYKGERADACQEFVEEEERSRDNKLAYELGKIDEASLEYMRISGLAARMQTRKEKYIFNGVCKNLLPSSDEL